MSLDQFSAQATNILNDLKLPPSAAAHHLTLKVPIAYTDETLGDIHYRLLYPKDKPDTINYVYVLSQHHTLVGVFSINKLFTKNLSTPVKDVMTKHPTVSHPQMSKTHVAYLAIKHNLKAIPIVDDKNHFLGVISNDKILDILYRRHQKHVLRAAGILFHRGQLNDTLSDNILTSFFHRIPWIIIGAIGGLLSANIVHSFEIVLQKDLILAAFIPLIVYNSDAVGTQTQTLIVRDLAINPKLPFGKYAIRQLLITLLIALVCGLLVFGIVTLFWHQEHLAFVITMATTIAITSSTFPAILVPYLLQLFHQDPANGSGPFATIIQDILSIIIYLTTASILL